MEWIRTHPYISALCAAGFAIVIGIWLVQRQGAAPTSNTATTWGGGTVGILDTTSYTSTQNTGVDERDDVENVQDRAPYTYIPPAIFSGSGVGAGSEPFDLNDFISKLTQSTTQSTSVTQSSTGTDIAIRDAYAFIPSGLISTTSPQQTLSSTQQALYNYGNTVGLYIQTFEQQYPGAAVILKDQVEDRTDPQKAAAVTGLARAMENVGYNLLEAIGDIPQGVASAHAALAQSYIEIGKNLALVPKTTNDTDFLSAIEVYNASADTFVKNYVALATLFSVYGVIFSTSDVGSVFMFTPISL